MFYRSGFGVDKNVDLHNGIDLDCLFSMPPAASIFRIRLQLFGSTPLDSPEMVYVADNVLCSAKPK